MDVLVEEGENLVIEVVLLQMFLGSAGITVDCFGGFMVWRCQQGFLNVAWAEKLCFWFVGLKGYMVASIGRVPSLL